MTTDVDEIKVPSFKVLVELFQAQDGQQAEQVVEKHELYPEKEKASKKTESKSKSTKKDKKRSAKNLEKEGKTLKEKAAEADQESRIICLEGPVKEKVAENLKYLIQTRPTLIEFIQHDSSQLVGVKELIAFGLWARVAKDVKEGKDVPDTKIQDLFNKDNDLVELNKELKEKTGYTIDYNSTYTKPLTAHQMNWFGKDFLTRTEKTIENFKTYIYNKSEKPANR